MAHLYKCFFIIGIYILFPSIPCAQRFFVDKLYYYAKNDTEAVVTHESRSYPYTSRSYSGKIIIPETLTKENRSYKVAHIGDWAFANSKQLTGIVIGEGIISIGYYSFYNCSGLKSLNIPSSVIGIGTDAFCGCHNLCKMALSPNLRYIGDNAFAYCISLKEVQIPDEVADLGHSAFFSCHLLSTVTFPQKINIIKKNMCYGCQELRYIEIGENTKRIEEGAFSYCSQLRELRCLSRKPPKCHRNVFLNTPINKVSLFVQKDAVADYKETFPWNQFKNIMGIE